MTKEILTDEHIRQDVLGNEVKKARTNDNKTLVWVMPIIAVAILAGVFVSWVWGVLIGLLSIIPIVLYFKQNQADNDVIFEVEHDGELIVEIDTLSHIDKELIYEPHTHRSFSGRTHTDYSKYVTVFYFDHGKWRIPETETLYAWSKEMYISPEGLDNTAVPGNRFYIVRRKGEAEIAYAYNTKFFEYKGKYNLS